MSSTLSLQEAIDKGMFFKLFKVSSTPDPSLRVRISEGALWLNNRKYILYEGGYSPFLQIPTSNARWVLLSLNPANRLPQITYGPIALDPVKPDCPSEHMPLAYILLESGMTKILNNQIYDARPFFISTKHFDAKDFIESMGGGIPIFEFSGDRARFYTLKPGKNISIQQYDPGELTFEVDVDIGFDDVILIDCGYFL